MICIENIVKTYKIRGQIIKAVDDISFNANEEEIVGFIGPNGAGKTTTLRILSGILVPDTGSVVVNGIVPWENRVNYVKNIGVMYGNRSLLWPELTLKQSLKSLKKIYQVPDDIFKKNFMEFIELLEIESLIDRPIRKMSLGQRMKCEMASCLIHSPKILFLDEPTIGMDVKTKEVLKKLLENIRQKGVITIFTSHDLHEVEKICNRVIVIESGKIIADDNTNSVKHRFGEGKLVIIYDLEREDYNELAYKLDCDANYDELRNTVTLTVSNGFNMEEILPYLLTNKLNFEIKDIDLETSILKALS